MKMGRESSDQSKWSRSEREGEHNPWSLHGRMARGEGGGGGEEGARQEGADRDQGGEGNRKPFQVPCFLRVGYLRSLSSLLFTPCFFSSFSS